jgi:hypothetical protein
MVSSVISSDHKDFGAEVRSQDDRNTGDKNDYHGTNLLQVIPHDLSLSLPPVTHRSRVTRF